MKWLTSQCMTAADLDSLEWPTFVVTNPLWMQQPPYTHSQHMHRISPTSESPCGMTIDRCSWCSWHCACIDVVSMDENRKWSSSPIEAHCTMCVVNAISVASTTLDHRHYEQNRKHSDRHTMLRTAHAWTNSIHKRKSLVPTQMPVDCRFVRLEECHAIRNSRHATTANIPIVHCICNDTHRIISYILCCRDGAREHLGGHSRTDSSRKRRNRYTPQSTPVAHTHTQT